MLGVWHFSLVAGPDKRAIPSVQRYMDENVIFSNDGFNMRIQQKTKVESLLKWLNPILYPLKTWG